MKLETKLILPETPTPTPTPTPTYNEFDTTIECDVTFDYWLQNAPTKQGMADYAKYQKTVTMSPFSVQQVMQFEFASTHINEGKHLQIKDLELSSEKTAPFLVEILNQEIIPPPELPDYESFAITDNSYDLVTLKNENIELQSAIADDYKSVGLTSTILTIEDLIENPNLITELGGPQALNNVGIAVREPSKLFGGSTSTNLYYESSIIRPFYLQLGRKGLLHTYNNSHVFAPHGLFIKSWRGSRKYAIRTNSLNDNVDTSYKAQRNIKCSTFNKCLCIFSRKFRGYT